MVDINLLGDDDTSEDRQREETYAKTVNLEEPTRATESGTSSFGRETVGASFQRDTVGSSFSRKSPENYGEGSSSRTKAYLIVLGLILAALTAVFFMIPRSGNKTQQIPPMQTLPEEDPLALGEATGIDSAAETSLPPAPSGEEAIAQLSPREQEVIASTRTGLWAVMSLVRSFASPNQFTLITYHGDGNNRFLVEFLSPSSEVTSSLTSAMQANVSPSDLKTVSESEQPSTGGAMRKILVAGAMDARAGLAGFQGTLNRLGSEQFSTWLRDLAQQQGLSIKNQRAGQASDAGVPMQIHVAGANAGVQAFMQEFMNANPNVTITKIILCPSDHKTFSDENLDLVMNFNLVEML